MANGEGGSLRRSDDVITGSSDTDHSSSGGCAGASGGLRSRSMSPVDGDGVSGVMFPSTDEQEETEDTTLTGRWSSERSALERVS